MLSVSTFVYRRCGVPGDVGSAIEPRTCTNFARAANAHQDVKIRDPAYGTYSICHIDIRRRHLFTLLARLPYFLHVPYA